MRTPIRRSSRGLQITAKAIAAFEEMQICRPLCTCDPIDWGGNYWQREECPACEDWWRHHGVLWNELNLRPWEWPAIQHPNARSPYPEGSEATRRWKPHLAAQERYRLLAEAAEQYEDEET